MKIKFYGNGHVWDPGNNKTLCTFVGGEYTTDKSEEIDILRKCKFKEEILEALTKRAPAPVVEVVAPAPVAPVVEVVVPAPEPSVTRNDPEVEAEAVVPEVFVAAPDSAPAVETQHQPKVVRKSLRKGY